MLPEIYGRYIQTKQINLVSFQGVDRLRRATLAAQSPCFPVADAFHPPRADAEGCGGRWVTRRGQEWWDFNSSTDALYNSSSMVYHS